MRGVRGRALRSLDAIFPRCAPLHTGYANPGPRRQIVHPERPKSLGERHLPDIGAAVFAMALEQQDRGERLRDVNRPRRRDRLDARGPRQRPAVERLGADDRIVAAEHRPVMRADPHGRRLVAAELAFRRAWRGCAARVRQISAALRTSGTMRWMASPQVFFSATVSPWPCTTSPIAFITVSQKIGRYFSGSFEKPGRSPNTTAHDGRGSLTSGAQRRHVRVGAERDHNLPPHRSGDPFGERRPIGLGGVRAIGERNLHGLAVEMLRPEQRPAHRDAIGVVRRG